MTQPPSTSWRPRTVAVIVNPAARNAVAPAAIARATHPLMERGWTFTVEEAESVSRTRTLAADHARRGTGVILSCGGDGALMQVLNGLRDAGSTEVEVGLIPTGTGNVWAREARIPRDLEGALALLEGGARRRVDLGVLRIGPDGDPLRFLLVCGVGLDAAIVQAVERRSGMKQQLGRLAFALPALVAGLTWRPAAARIEVDRVATDHPALLVALVANTRRYGGVARVTDSARIDDGLLDVVTIEDATDAASLAERGMLVLEGLRGGLDARAVDGMTYLRGARVMVTPSRPLLVQADGDSVGACGPEAPLIVDVEPSAVTMIVGPGPNALWST